jgi:uncharacterized protein HemX
MELRRAEVAKKRPSWMLAVTGLALIAASGLGWFAYARAAERDQAEKHRIAAIAAKRQAQEDAHRTREQLQRLEDQLAQLDAQVAKAQEVLLAAQTQADRDRAAAEILEANRHRARIRLAKEEADRKRLEEERSAGFDTDGCLHNSLDCMDGVKTKKPRSKR